MISCMHAKYILKHDVLKKIKLKEKESLYDNFNNNRVLTLY